MARTDTLPNFLTDVADAIRTKTGSSELITASDFDTIIENLPSGEDTGAYKVNTVEEMNELTGMKTGDYCVVENEQFIEGYTLVNYIESTGEQYINTGYTANNNTSINITFQTKNVSEITENESLFGARASSSSRHNGVTIGSNHNLYVGYNVYSRDTGFAMADNTQYNIEKYHQYCTINGQLLTTFANTTFTTPGPMYIFAMDQSGATFMSSIKLYYFSIVDNLNTARTFLPCYRNSDNKPGLYDTVNDVFYTNQGTGEFLIGDPIKNTQIYYYDGLSWIQI